MRWGRNGAQRWRCSGCGATWSGRSGTPLARMHRPDLVVALARDMIEAPQPMSCRRAAEALGASRHSIWRWRIAIISALMPEPDGTLAGVVEGCHRGRHRSEPRWQRGAPARKPQGLAGMGPAPARSCDPPRAAAPDVAGLPAAGRFGDGATGRLARLGEEAPRGHGPCWPSGLRGYRGCRPGGDLRRPAAGAGAGRGALHRRPCHLREDREGRTHPAFGAQCRAALEADPAQPPHQNRQRPDRPVPYLHPPLLRTRLEEPRRLRPMACRPRQRGSQLPRRPQAAARLRPPHQHGLLTPPDALYAITVIRSFVSYGVASHGHSYED